MTGCYLVTGGAGFIGSHLVRRLLAAGAEVRVFDNFSTGSRAHLSNLAVEIIEGDVRDAAAVARAVQGIAGVVHLAALPSVEQSVRDPATTHAVNVTGTLHVLQAAHAAGVARVVYASSCAIYGNEPTIPKHEAMLPFPASPYAASKLAGEYYCRVFSDVYGMQAVVLRYFNVFGPRQDPSSPYAAAIPRFITRTLTTGAPVVFGDGRQTRDFVYVDNVVDANILALNPSVAAGQVVNIAGGEQWSLLQVLELLGKILGRSVVPHFEPSRDGEVVHSVAAIGHARQMLGYAPTIAFATGLQRTVEWFQQQSNGGMTL